MYDVGRDCWVYNASFNQTCLELTCEDWQYRYGSRDSGHGNKCILHLSILVELLSGGVSSINEVCVRSIVEAI